MQQRLQRLHRLAIERTRIHYAARKVAQLRRDDEFRRRSLVRPVAVAADATRSVVRRPLARAI